MTSAEGITKLGFRRWYERQLIEGHVYLVTCVLSMILLAACLEQMDWRGPMLQLLFLLIVVAGAGVLCFTSLRRYNFILLRAESLGAQSSCAHCSVYGVLQVMSAGTGDEQVGGGTQGEDNPWIRVRCKKCGHEWLMDNS